MKRADSERIQEEKRVFLCLGSNLSKRFQNIHNAIIELSNNSSISLKKSSSFYLTEPVDYDKQPWFVNVVLEIATNMSPMALLKYVKSIENKLGRKPSFSKGPRIIDIDILFYGNDKINLPELILPHPEITKRKFVLRALLEIDNLNHPILKKSIKEIFNELKSDKRSYKIPSWVLIKIFHFEKKCEICKKLFSKV